MAKKLYEERNIQDIAEAIREKTGETRMDDVLVDAYVYKTTNMEGFDSTISVVAYGLDETTLVVKDAANMIVKYVLKANSGFVLGDFWINGVNYRYSSNNGEIYEIPIEGNQVILKFDNITSSSLRGLYAEVYAYDSKGNRVGIPSGVKKEVPNTFRVSEMASAVRSMSSGLPEEAYVISGDCTWRWSVTGGNWYFDVFGNQLTTKDITNFGYAFNGNNKITKIPCTINIKNCSNFTSSFSNCSALEECPKIRGTISWSTSTTFGDIVKGCSKLKSVDDLFEPGALDDFSTIKVTGSYSCPKATPFTDCRSLRKLPHWFYSFRLNEESTAYPASSTNYNIYANMVQSCYVLDEVINIPVWKCAGALTSNMFSYTTNNTYRLKNFTFETQPDGTPCTTEWKSQTIDLTTYVGYATSANNVISYGIASDKQVKDLEQYNALKDDPDWFTADMAFARYNHDSAVATINSLPDTSAYLASAGGTNTIKFKGNQGAITDGGAIKTLTAEEIAVATAKGWTVTLA